MIDGTYQVILETMTGQKHGTLYISQDCEHHLTGYLDILNAKDAMEGTIHTDGSCQITGKLTTLFRNISYQAVGHIDEKSVELFFHTDKYTMSLLGTNEN